ncbi:helix-loop-helix DNA-binding domain-domain-containing protein [Absidia repens]|uniref:Helix-loop-helix DNA-binding domain-domain-containing protein n=1 Tax=Absidia repens TaxID=90262 RepID=A0A1X2IEI2_9FUNG|nr:helix-loop-helix DNA-binding domain-domain-containing protein [Absidia repens]
MESFLFDPELDQFGNSNDPFFSLSLFDLDLQQQPQSATHQQQQQPQSPRSIQELWQDSDCYLPIECQSFTMNESAMTNVSTIASTVPLLISDSSTYDPNSTSYAAAMTNNSDLHFQPTVDVIPASDFDATNSMISSQLTRQDTVKEGPSHPGQYNITPSSPQYTDWKPSISPTPPQQNSCNNTAEQTSMSASLPRSTSTTGPDVANIIIGINRKLPILSHTDSNRIPIHPLKPATESRAPPSSSSTHIPTSGRKQKKTAHNAIEKRYRNNINNRITELKNAVPALAHSKSTVEDCVTGARNACGMMDDDGEEYLDGVAVTTKLNKATILHKATEYINHLKQTNNVRQWENESLQLLLAQLPGGHELLTRHQVQKRQREQMMQRQLAMECQWMKQDQQLRKQQATNEQKRAPSRRQLNKNGEGADDGSLSSISGGHPRTPLTNRNRIFMAVFIAITYFSPSLTTPTSSQQTSDHNHVSRTASEQLIISSSTLNSTEFTSKHYDIPWRLSMDRWYGKMN